MTDPAAADTSVFDLAERRLAWLARRQGVLAQNIANADTPGYDPRDLASFDDQLRRAQFTIAPARTNPLHLPGTIDAGAARPGEDVRVRPGARGINGNGVQVEAELAKVADTDTSQEMVSDLYTKYAGLFRLALGR